MNLIRIFRFFAFCLLLLIHSVAEAQYNKSIDKLFVGSDYSKLRTTLDKKFVKDSLNPLYSYYYARYFFAEKKLDSAYFFSLKARDSYRRLEKKNEIQMGKKWLFCRCAWQAKAVNRKIGIR